MGNYTNQDCLNEIQKVSTAKLSIKTAIESKGVTVPADTTFAGYAELIENIPQAKPEETLTQTITENGSHVFNPSEGHVFNSASITVDVPDPVLGTLNVTPTTSEQNITAQAEGYKGFSEVNVSAVTSSIDSNIAAENIKKDVTILGVTGTLESGGKDYRYKTGAPSGLTAIGWDTDSIGYYSANTSPSYYAWESDNYKVSQENIDLYSQDDPQPSLYKDNPNVTFVPNKNMSIYFGGGIRAFNGMKYIKGIPVYDTSSVTNMNFMFNGCSSLQYIPQLNTSNVTSMNSMFGSCSSLTSIPQLNTSNVTNMAGMFNGCSSLTSIPQLDTSKVTNMINTFSNCSSLQYIPQLDTSSVTSMNSMFYNCSSLQYIPQLDTSSVTSMNSMFYNCSSLQRIDGIDFSSMTSKPTYLFGNDSTEILTFTHLIVNGSINFTWNDNYGIFKFPNLDYESIKSILEAMNRTTNTDQKTMKFNQTIADQNGELAGLVSACNAKNWSIRGLYLN